MFGIWGKEKINSASFVELFYNFAHTVSFGGLDASKEVYQKYFPGIALQNIGNERMVFIIWWLDVKLVEMKSSKRSDVMLGVIGKYLHGNGIVSENLLESKEFIDMRLKFADYYSSAANTKDGQALVHQFIKNVINDADAQNNLDRGNLIDANLAEIVGGIESNFTSKYVIQ